jgi:hypothetical protein
MTKLIEQLRQAHRDFYEKGKLVERTAENTLMLNNELHAKREAIFAQMSREELEYAYENYVFHGMAKKSFREKWLKAN